MVEVKSMQLFKKLHQRVLLETTQTKASSKHCGAPEALLKRLLLPLSHRRFHWHQAQVGAGSITGMARQHHFLPGVASLELNQTCPCRLL